MINACTVSTRWQEKVSRAGVDAGAPFAVVSTVHNRVDVVGTADDLDRAREARFTYALGDAEYLTMMYVIRGAGGVLALTASAWVSSA